MTSDVNFNGALRRISSAGPGILGGPRALLMQIAHPKVAQGVEDHSEFRTSPFPRLIATMHLLFAILYGDTAEADEAVERMHKRHRQVRSSVGEVESHYSANDPELKCWVWATLVDTTAKLYEEFVGPISSHEQSMLYSDWVLLGQKLGIPYDSMPKDHVVFADYMESTIRSLEVTEVARAQAAYILDTGNISQTLPWMVRQVATKFIERQGQIASKVTIATLPHQLREACGERPLLTV